MKRLATLVFDEVIHGAGSIVYTSAKLEDLLGAPDKLSFHVICDNVTTSGTLSLRLEQSSDRRNWLAKNSVDELTCATTQGSTTQAYGNDDGVKANLAFIRVKLTLNTSTIAHVRVYVTGRDN